MRKTRHTPPDDAGTCLLRQLSVCLLLVLITGTLTVPCMAGHYEGPVYTSPNGYLYLPNLPLSPFPYGPYQGGWGNGSGQPSYASCSGEITATFTWVEDWPGDAPPINVVVKETSTAQWKGWAFWPLNGSCSNGMQSPVVVTPWPDAPPGSTNAVYTSTGTRYVVLPGEPTITRRMSPSASSSGNIMCAASVCYSASVHPVVCTLYGTTSGPSDHTQNILIGQGCSAGLTVPGFTLSNHRWTITGYTFASYDVDPNGQNWARVTYVDDQTLHSDSPHWYWRREGANTVSCVADVTVDGVCVATVTGSVGISVFAPDYWFPSPDTYTPSSFMPGDSGVQAAPVGMDKAIEFSGQAYTPDLFNPDPDTFGYAGEWKFVQLCQISKRQWVWSSPFPTVFTTNNEMWLDNQDPYNSTNTPYSAHWFDEFPVGSEVDTDNPGLEFVPGVAKFDISDSFEMYMLYLPPPANPGSPDVQWVGLAKFEWEWWAENQRTGLVYGGPWSVLPPSDFGHVIPEWEVERIFYQPLWENKWTNHQ